MNLRQAPELCSIGEKNRETNSIKGKAIRTHLLETIIMNGLGERDMAQLKIMLFLTGNAANSGYKIAEKTICERCKISESGYKKARKALVELGWIKHENGSITVDYDAIYSSANGVEGFTEDTSLGITENTHNNISNSENGATVTDAPLDPPKNTWSAKIGATRSSSPQFLPNLTNLPIISNPTNFLKVISAKGIPIHKVNQAVVEIDGTLYRVCNFDDGYTPLMEYAEMCGKGVAI